MNPNISNLPVAATRYNSLEYHMVDLVPPRRPTSAFELLARDAYVRLAEADHGIQSIEHAHLLVTGGELIELFYLAVIETALTHIQSDFKRYIALLGLCINSNAVDFQKSAYYQAFKQRLCRLHDEHTDRLEQHLGDVIECERDDTDTYDQVPVDESVLERIMNEQQQVLVQISDLMLHHIWELPNYIGLVRYIVLSLSYHGVFTMWLADRNQGHANSSDVEVEFEFTETNCDHHDVTKHEITTMVFHWSSLKNAPPLKI